MKKKMTQKRRREILNALIANNEEQKKIDAASQRVSDRDEKNHEKRGALVTELLLNDNITDPIIYKGHVFQIEKSINNTHFSIHKVKRT